MRPAAAALLVALATTAAPAAASGAAEPPRPLRVVDRQVVSSPAPPCERPDYRRGAEASPSTVTDGRRSWSVWQQDVTHAAGGAIETLATSLSSRLGGPCGAPVTDGALPGTSADNAGLPSTARGSDGRVWTVVHENGAQVSRVLLSDGGRTVLVDERRGSPSGTTELLSATVAVDPQDPGRVHVAYAYNLFPAGTVNVHREVRDGTVSSPHVIGAGPTPAAYDFREQLVALGGESLLALSTEVAQDDLVDLAPTYAERTDLTQAPVVVRARRSSDGGATWSQPVVVLEPENGSVRDPAGGTALRSLVHPSVAVGPDGRVHVAVESVGPSSTTLLSRSTSDGGVTWSPATQVVRPGVALQAAVAVDGRGRLALSWLEVAPDLTATWRAAVVGQRVPAVLGPAFSLRALAPAYVGDQGSLAGLDHGFVAVVVEGTGSADDPTDVVRVTLR